MSQVTIRKPKRKVNRSKRAKVGSHGLKVYKNTYVYIAKASAGGWCRDGKPAPKAEVVAKIIELFNHDKSIRKIAKHIKKISIKYSDHTRRAGSWTTDSQWFEFVDSKYITPEDAEEIVFHEIIGHAYWDWAREWRNESWRKFNELAHNTPAVNDYVAEYYKNKVDYRTDTIFENEQHSAITELVKHGSSYHTRTGKNGEIASEEQINALIRAWEEFHY